MQPLSAQEEEVWRTLVRLMVVLPRTMDDDLRSETGLSLTHYIVLVALSEASDGHLRMSDLAQRIALSPEPDDPGDLLAAGAGDGYPRVQRLRRPGQPGHPDRGRPARARDGLAHPSHERANDRAGPPRAGPADRGRRGRAGSSRRPNAHSPLGAADLRQVERS